MILLLVSIPVIGFLLYDRGDIPFQDFFVVEQDERVIRIGTVPIRATVADTREARARGLSGRDELLSTHGLLFVFEESDFHGFWMKEMRFPIDIIWINDSFVVVDIEENVSPSTFPKTFEPRRPARFVVEVNANFADSFGIEVGDVLTLPEEWIPEDLR